MRNLKLDESCISNPKSEVSNWTQSNSRFRISDLRCRIRPISIFLLMLSVSFLLSAADGFPSFVDVAEKVGITLVNICGGASKDYIIEANGNGAAFIDYDNDGDLDVLITNGSTLKHFANGGDPIVTLYENVGGRFRDVTAQAHLDKKGWAFGVCVADYDNDGYEDFYVTAYGPNLLFHNNGDGTFEERAAAAGVADPHWGTGCAFGDYDRDGYVDLYVANYVAFDQNSPPRDCVYMGTLKVFCGPKGLVGEADVL